MSARDELIGIVTRDPESSGGDRVWATDLVDAHRDEVTRRNAQLLQDRAHQADWDKTPEFRAGLREAAELLTLAAGGQNPADFFQAGRTYRSRRCADLRFECLALSADPDNGERQAIGWRFGPPHNGVRRHRLAALGADDWACCDWTDTTESGDAS